MNNIKVSIFILILSISIAFYKFFIQNVPKIKEFHERDNLIIWTASSSVSHDHSVFHTINITARSLNHTIASANDSDFDILWSFEYFFDKFPESMQNIKLKPHQMVNHVPAITFLTNKLHLAVTASSQYVPNAFNFPNLKNEFLYYAKLFPKAKFVLKNMDRGGVEIVPFEKINFSMGSWKYLQLFIKPFLIHEHAFDFAVYVLITSADPLRLYRWNHDIYIRFCSQKFHKFDYNVKEKFNCAYNYKNIWKMDQFKGAMSLKNSEILHGFLKSSENFEKEIDDAIVTTVLSKTPISKRYSSMYEKKSNNSLNHFFELLRFDFILDVDEKLHLIEVNMSPDMNFQHEKNDRNEIMSRKVVNDTLKIIGAGNYEDYAECRLSKLENKTVDLQSCKDCINSCENPSCELCLNCISADLIQSIHESYREHHRRGEFKRIFPSNKYNADEDSKRMMTEKMKILGKWFGGKCKEDESWC